MPAEPPGQPSFNRSALTMNQNRHGRVQVVMKVPSTRDGVMTKFIQSACFVFMASTVIASAIASVVL